jgi:DNA polymerase-3 subunit delta'
MSKFIILSRSFDAYRVILLQPVEAMNMNAANSLLKSLEEPADNTVIILLATHLNQVLPTIKSRCQLLTLPTPTMIQSLEWLKKNSPQLENAKELLDMSFGRPLLAFDIKEEDFNQRNDFAFDILSIIQEKKSVIEIAKKWEKSDFKSLIKWQSSWLQGFIKNDIVNTNNESNQTTPLLQHLSKINESIKSEQQWLLYQEIIELQRYIHTSVNPLMLIENMLTLWFKASRQCQ